MLPPRNQKLKLAPVTAYSAQVSMPQTAERAAQGRDGRNSWMVCTASQSPTLRCLQCSDSFSQGPAVQECQLQRMRPRASRGAQNHCCGAAATPLLSTETIWTTSWRRGDHGAPRPGSHRVSCAASTWAAPVVAESCLITSSPHGQPGSKSLPAPRHAMTGRCHEPA